MSIPMSTTSVAWDKHREQPKEKETYNHEAADGHESGDQADVGNTDCKSHQQRIRAAPKLG
jgi:hypothetical protein